jgi:hypothetical protein
MKLHFSPATSKTIWGAIIGLVGWLAQPDVLALLPEKTAAIITAVGGLLAAIGLRSAVAANGPSVTPDESAKANGSQ